MAPIEVQKQAKCIIGKDYPKPIVDHAIESKANMGKMAEAYKKYKSWGLDICINYQFCMFCLISL